MNYSGFQLQHWNQDWKKDVFNATVTKLVSARCCYPWHPTSAPVLPPPDALRFGHPPPALRGVSLPAVVNPTVLLLVIPILGAAFASLFESILLATLNNPLNNSRNERPISVVCWFFWYMKNFHGFQTAINSFCILREISFAQWANAVHGTSQMMGPCSHGSLPYTSHTVVFNMFSWKRGNMICISQPKISKHIRDCLVAPHDPYLKLVYLKTNQ